MSFWKKLAAGLRFERKWKQIEYFDPRWRNRIEGMSRYIGPSESVLDLGCGPMWLKEFLGPANRYFPCDYKDRGSGTLLCDFNARQFPDVRADVAFISGSLEYIDDYEWFVGRVTAASTKCVIAYCVATPESTLSKRRQNAWVNHLTEGELVGLFQRHGMKLAERGERYMSSRIYVFKRTAS